MSITTIKKMIKMSKILNNNFDLINIDFFLFFPRLLVLSVNTINYAEHLQWCKPKDLLL